MGKRKVTEEYDMIMWILVSLDLFFATERKYVTVTDPNGKKNSKGRTSMQVNPEKMRHFKELVRCSTTLSAYTTMQGKTRQVATRHSSLPHVRFMDQEYFQREKCTVLLS